MAVDFKLKDGTVVHYDDDFSNDDKLIKKLRCVRDGDSEGPWMLIHRDDLEAYNNDVIDNAKTRLGAACNSFLNGIPWGAVFPYKLCGKARPVCDMDKLVDTRTDCLFCAAMFISSLENRMAEKSDIDDATVACYTRVLGEDHEIVIKIKEYVYARLEES